MNRVRQPYRLLPDSNKTASAKPGAVHFDFKCPIEVMSEVMQKALAMQYDAPASIQ